MTVCLFLERGTDPLVGTGLHQRMVHRPVFHFLEPPPLRGQLTMLDVPFDGDPELARAAGDAWVDDAWKSWRTHHRMVREWVDTVGIDSRGDQ